MTEAKAKSYPQPTLTGEIRSGDGRSWAIPTTAAEYRAYIHGRWKELREAGHSRWHLAWLYLRSLR